MKILNLFYVPKSSWLPFAINDIRTQFRRSVIGPFWLAISSGILILSLSTIFSHVLQIPIIDYMPYVGLGVVSWSFINSVISESGNSLITARQSLLNLPLSPMVYIYRSITRSFINLFVNFTTILLFFIILKPSLLSNVGYTIIGFILLAAILVPIGIMISIFCLRYRDIPHIITNFMQVMFFLTPVFWDPSLMLTKPFFINFNPFYYLIRLVREPIISMTSDYLILLMWGSIVGLFLWIICSITLDKTFKQLAYWS